ncbi:MAG: hypothetical protein SOW84_02135 [Candidatus Faecousia sp.]|nr:hypothetical protein [Candidatus Faecousia sp.]
MAKLICPCCGKPYNGKRCKSCLYESFSEEITHGLHSHNGEPLIVDDTVRKPIPRRDPLACDPKTKKRSARVLILVAVILLMVALMSVAISVYTSVSAMRRTVVQLPDASLPENGTTLYEADGILIVADWKDGLENPDRFAIAMRNDTGRNLTLCAKQVIVNGYLMDRSLLSCQAPKGHTGADDFSLNQEELAYSGIDAVQSLSIALLAYDSDSMETVAEIGPLHLGAKAMSNFQQPDADSGDALYEVAGLRVEFRGYLPNSYDQEVSRGKLLLYLENSADYPMNICLQEATVNGAKAALHFWCTLPAHTRTVARMHLFALEDMDIHQTNQISDMTLQLEVQNAESCSDPVTIGPFSISITD